MAVRLLRAYPGDAQYPTGLAANYIYDGPQQEYLVEIGAADRRITQATDFSSYITAKPNAIYPIRTMGEENAANGLWAPTQGVDIYDRTTGRGFSLLLLTDSMMGNNRTVPNATFGGTTSKGTYLDASNTKLVGVTNVYAENPCRVAFRTAHNLVTGDEGLLDGLPTGNALNGQRYTVTVIDATTIALNVDASAGLAFTSAGQAGDAFFNVDNVHSSFGTSTWLLAMLGQPWDTVSRRGAVSGTSTAQLAARVADYINGQHWNDVWLWIGRNDAFFDQASFDIIYPMVAAACDNIWAFLPYPDNPSSTAIVSKLSAESSYWYSKAAIDPKINIVDAFGVVADPAATNQAGLARLLAGDGVHTANNGAACIALAASQTPRAKKLAAKAKTASRAANSNLVTNGRLTGTGGILTGVITGSGPASWTFGERNGANLTGGFMYPARTPATLRLNSTAYAQGDLLYLATDPFNWYLCIAAGTSAASLPAGYATLALWDWTGVTDGTGVFVKIPIFTTDGKQNIWRIIDIAGSDAAPSSDSINFLQNFAMGSVTAGQYLQAEADLIVFGNTPSFSLALSIMDSSFIPGTSQGLGNLALPGQLARGVDFAPASLTSIWPFATPLQLSLKTGRIKVPAAAARIDVRANFGTNAAARSRFAITNIQATVVS